MPRILVVVASSALEVVWCWMNKLLVAMAAYAVLAALAWTTLSDPKFKFATLAILAMFAFAPGRGAKSWSRNSANTATSKR